MSVTVRTQDELDQALADHSDVICIDSDPGVWLSVADSGSSHVVALGSAHVVALGSARVEARDSSRVVALGSSHVIASDSAYVKASGSARIEASDSAHVIAWHSAYVKAWGSALVVARDSSRVEALGSVYVEARGSSHIVAGKYVAVYRYSQHVTLDAKGPVIDMTAVNLDDPATWCDYHGVHVAEGIAYLYKAVNRQWTTDRGVDYSPGSTPEAPDWDPDWRGCGHGLHLCADPMQSLAYLGLPADKARFLRVGVRLDELVPLGDKVRARRVVVPCVEVDLFGEVVDRDQAPASASSLSGE